MGISEPGDWLWNFQHQHHAHVIEYRQYMRYLRMYRHPITFRMRRGRVVDIPEKWQGVVTRHQTQRKRRQRAEEKRLERRLRLRAEARWDSQQWYAAMEGA